MHKLIIEVERTPHSGQYVNRRFGNLIKRALWTMALSLSLGACGDDVGDVEASKMIDGHNENPNEVMTNLRLTFRSLTDEETFSVSWSDPGLSPVPSVDDIVLPYGRTYRVELEVFNELEIPVEDITPEIRDEMDEHQVFFVGSAVEGPASTTNPNAIIQQLYDDVDNYGYPIGLKSTIVSTNKGSGVLSIQLRHLPMLKGELLKYDGLAALMANEGEQAMPGSTDISVDINITVQ